MAWIKARVSLLRRYVALFGRSRGSVDRSAAAAAAKQLDSAAVCVISQTPLTETPTSTLLLAQCSSVRACWIRLIKMLKGTRQPLLIIFLPLVYGLVGPGTTTTTTTVTTTTTTTTTAFVFLTGPVFRRSLQVRQGARRSSKEGLRFASARSFYIEDDQQRVSQQGTWPQVSLHCVREKKQHQYTLS